MKNTNTIIILIVFCVLFAGCRNHSTRKINLIVQNDFSGVIFIKRNANNLSHSNKSNEVLTIVIPQTGVASTPSYDIFSEWHTISVSSKGNLDASFVLYQLGEVDKNRMVYFFGTPAQYELKIKRASVSELAPGMLK